jgi:DNA ligase-1
MKLFTQLFTRIDQTTKTNEKVDALAWYFSCAPDKDRLWTIALLSHKRPKRTVSTALLRQWASELAGIPLWLFEESYHVVGDLGEAIALALPTPTEASDLSLSYWMDYIQACRGLDEAEKKEKIQSAWLQLSHSERFLFNKLIMGGFRMGVSQKLIVKALSRYTGIEENAIAHRLMGNWTPDDTSFEALVLTESPLEDSSKPYPFYLAYPLEGVPEDLGAPAEWIAERKWDGIRGQLIIRKGELFVWSRGEELITDKFPEFAPLSSILPGGTVFDGEILPFKDGQPLSFNSLQTRIGRKNVTRKVLAEAPVILMAYDLLEWEGKDLRDLPFVQRRQLLEKAIHEHPAGSILQPSPLVAFSNWETLAEERDQSRQHLCEGLMLKRKESAYQTGRKKGSWWKWKVDPLTIDAVMIYAQRGHGRRANLYTDFTFAVWDDDKLVPFTKAYSGLTDKEFQEITNWVKRHTVERFGPVRSVEPVQVFELAFEGIRASNRHKSGVLP